MRHVTTLIVAIASLVSCVAADGQTSAAALSDELRAHLRDERFQIVTSLRGLPLGVRDALGELVGGQYTDFAEPGTPFRATDVVLDPKLPARRMVLAACSTDHHCIVYYERGGIAHTWHTVIFQWSPAATEFQWGGHGAGGLRSIDAVQAAILSGAIKGASSGW